VAEGERELRERQRTWDLRHHLLVVAVEEGHDGASDIEHRVDRVDKDLRGRGELVRKRGREDPKLLLLDEMSNGRPEDSQSLLNPFLKGRVEASLQSDQEAFATVNLADHQDDLRTW
jgi:hypothetical protein